MHTGTAAPSILLASRSRDKVREITQILAPSFAGSIVTLDDVGIPASPEEDDIEAFHTFVENAHAKAAWFMALAGIPTLADDSGISVDALGGAPGVRSKRFSGRSDLGGPELDDANNERLLRELEGRSHEERAAHYTCAAVLHMPDGRRCATIGIRAGFILTEPRGSNGFGYDPLFLDPVTGLSFGETEPDAKNRTSHRARAFRALAANFPVL
jgi:XTP/dITP diphosphohydrolase